MEILTLDVQTRDKSRDAKNLLRDSLIPLEYYGRGVDNQSLQVDYQTFRKLFRISGTNTIIELNIDDKQKTNVLAHRVDYDPITDEFSHVDFIDVKMGEELQTKIPLEFVGDAPAVRELAGVFTHHMTEIEVKCLPRNLVHTIKVDIESLVDFNSYIRVKDLVLPEGISVAIDPEDVIATVVPPREEEVVEEGAEGAEAEGGAEKEAASEEGGDKNEGEGKE